MRKIKISAISDLHGNLPSVDFFTPGDVLCIAGDIVPLDIQKNDVKSIAWFCSEFIPWTDKLPFKKVILVFGNHDFFAQHLGPDHLNNGNGLMSLLMPGYIKGKHKIVILCDDEYEYMNFKFYGTSWCPDLTSWAFYGDSNKLTHEFGTIPNCDVLISHCPPRLGNAGVVLQNGFNYLRDFGCQELADAITSKNIKWVFCGHVHSGDHHPLKIDERTNIVNVSVLDENYKKSYSPFTVEITK